MIIHCSCGDYRSPGAAYQNTLYGYGNRVCNPGAKNKKGQARCTVCGNWQSAPKVASKAGKA